MNLIRVYIRNKYLIGFRIVMLLLALPIAIDIYEIVQTGEAVRKDVVLMNDNNSHRYYAYLLKQVMFFCFFFWLGTFGSKGKDENQQNKP